MLDLAPFVILCVVLAVVLVTPFALWHRRDIKRGKPWDADSAAKIYIGLIAGTFVASLGLASTPLVSVAGEEPTQGPTEHVSVAASGEEATGSPSPAGDESAAPAIDGDEIVLTDGHGVDLDTADRQVLPTSGTPGIDVALNGDSLYTPSGEVFERVPSPPDISMCRAASADSYYDELVVDQWFCLATSASATGTVRVLDVAKKSSGTEVTVAVELLESVQEEQDDSPDADITGSVTLIDDQGIDLDTDDRTVLPTSDTQGLDLGVYNDSLYTPDGTSFVRATTKPTRQRCDALDGTSYYDDITQGQWFCFTTSEGRPGRLQVTSAAERSDGTEYTLSHALFN